MALSLVEPGKRGNKVYVARGRVNGRLYEISLKTTNRREAEKALRGWQADLDASGPKGVGLATFADAAARYRAFRKAPARLEDETDIDALVSEIGRRRLRDITVADLHELADRLKPGAAGATKNRHVLRPAASILHHAADTGLCDWLKIKEFPENKPVTHALAREEAARLIEAAGQHPLDGAIRRLLLLWLFHQGMRITHTLNVTWDKIDMARGTVAHRELKGRRPHDYVFPLHQEVLDELHKIPPAERRGRVFPWRGRTGVSWWLSRLSAEIGVPFTPHMARHSRGTWLNEEGAGLRTIMEALGHASEKSSLRYQHGNVEVVRAVGSKISLKGEVA